MELPPLVQKWNSSAQTISSVSPQSLEKSSIEAVSGATPRDCPPVNVSGITVMRVYVAPSTGNYGNGDQAGEGGASLDLLLTEGS